MQEGLGTRLYWTGLLEWRKLL